MHTSPRRTPLSKNTARSNKLRLLQVAQFKNLKWTLKEHITPRSAFESFTLLIKDPEIK